MPPAIRMQYDPKTFDFSVGPKEIFKAGGHIFPTQVRAGSETATTPRQRDAGARLHMLR
jgi:hypothetical protein